MLIGLEARLVKRKESTSFGRTPLWVKVQGSFVALLVLVVIAMISGFLGGHGGSSGVPHSHQQTMGGH